MTTIFTRSDVTNPKGYWQRTVASLFAAHPTAQTIIVSDRPPTGNGCRYVRELGVTAGAPVLYYRKSSGGRWGHSVQISGVEVVGMVGGINLALAV